MADGAASPRPHCAADAVEHDASWPQIFSKSGLL